ncbi:unnamed protein product [Soboliphyme baturini]|uniref:Uncharacterized protein n=1 Tax=Soboliphyme baturini TaxID=241478 RepID=A0A183IRV1_9BILA|nr:unnamed protein product [Soboliphyme baturini]
MQNVVLITKCPTKVKEIKQIRLDIVNGSSVYSRRFSRLKSGSCEDLGTCHKRHQKEKGNNYYLSDRQAEDLGTTKNNSLKDGMSVLAQPNSSRETRSCETPLNSITQPNVKQISSGTYTNFFHLCVFTDSLDHVHIRGIKWLNLRRIEEAFFSGDDASLPILSCSIGLTGFMWIYWVCSAQSFSSASTMAKQNWQICQMRTLQPVPSSQIHSSTAVCSKRWPFGKHLESEVHPTERFLSSLSHVFDRLHHDEETRWSVSQVHRSNGGLLVEDVAFQLLYTTGIHRR